MNCRKTCPRCGGSEVIRKGVKRGNPYWYYKSYLRYFSDRSKPTKDIITSCYAKGKHATILLHWQE